jgi:hypothetical protein
MRGAASWLVLIIVFFIAGGGFSLIRVGVINQMAGMPDQWWRFVLGALLAIIGTAYLGGFIYYRDKKHGRIKRPDLFRTTNSKKQD